LNLAPIVIFAFNRPLHLGRLLNSLLGNPEAKDSIITIFVDGPRNLEDQKSINGVLSTIEEFKDSLQIEAIKSMTNKGLASSILSGIDYMFEIHDTVIVLEDDLVLANTFLKFCNEGLAKFRDCPSIASVQGYSPIFFNDGYGTYFLKGADCWGWATWKDRWLSMNRDSNELLTRIENSKVAHAFDLDGSFPYTDMLRRQAKNQVDSWAIRWHASMFLQGRLSLYPSRSLVLNTGFDGSGTHKGNFLYDEIAKGLPNPDYYPEFDTTTPKESQEARSSIIRNSRKRYNSYPYWHPKGLLRAVFRSLKRFV
jgi:hypothetical protein